MDSKKIQEETKKMLQAQQQGKYDAYDLRFMSSLSEAILAKAPKSSRRILWIIFISVIWLIVWASFAEVDEITRGQGKIIPSGQNQMVQNLEGGIVSELLVREGDMVDKGQILLKIDNKSFSSSYEESEIRKIELRAKYLRLDAEANSKPLVLGDENKDIAKQFQFEESLYKSNQKQLEQKTNILQEQIRQRTNELNELRAKIRELKYSYSLMKKEVDITEPLLKKGLVSEVEFLQLQRQANSLNGELNAANLSVPRVKSTIKEAQNKINELKLSFINDAKKELNEVAAELARLSETQISLKDRVQRTLVRAPVSGIVTRMMIHTVSGVIKPGMDLMEIVPLEDTLVAEVKIKPADVAFLREGLKAIVKFTAYDFSIYGGLDGTLENISADTTTNERGESYYLATIKTTKNHLGNDQNMLRIMVGMTVSADIITGKKTVLDYLLKPILKAKQNALRER